MSKSLIIKSLILFAFLNFAQKLVALDAQQIFQRANQNYEAGNFRLAQQDYEAILTEGKIFSKELFFNLGNCYFRQNQLGRALLNYERALKVEPNDGEVLQNIAVVRSRLNDEFESPNEVFFVRWLRDFQQLFSADSWSVFALFWLWIAAGGFGIWLLGKERDWKKRGFITGCTALPLSILLILMAWSSASASKNQFGIVLAPQITLHVAPDTNAAVAQTLHEGLKVEILEKMSAMCRIKLPNGEEGWIDLNTIETI